MGTPWWVPLSMVKHGGDHRPCCTVTHSRCAGACQPSSAGNAHQVSGLPSAQRTRYSTTGSCPSRFARMPASSTTSCTPASLADSPEGGTAAAVTPAMQRPAARGCGAQGTNTDNRCNLLLFHVPLIRVTAHPGVRGSTAATVHRPSAAALLRCSLNRPYEALAAGCKAN